mmetsp:Transcript_5328/g.13213  ORF Transcript_5328/g.13213 Transcript_5328/m.13213 type:complete len:101 (+) Transcript_5328:100-402(+)
MWRRQQRQELCVAAGATVWRLKPWLRIAKRGAQRNVVVPVVPSSPLLLPLLLEPAVAAAELAEAASEAAPSSALEPALAPERRLEEAADEAAPAAVPPRR